MKTTINEITNKIYRICVEVPADQIPIPGGFTFNQYLVVDEQPLLMHTGPRPFFPMVKQAIETVMPIERLRYIAFSHHEEDESGSLNSFLAEAPDAIPLCGQISAMVNGTGMDKPAKAMADGETLSLGEKIVSWIDAPHMPHGWDCGLLYEKTTQTLFCSDLFTQPGTGMEPLTETDILETSEAMRAGMEYFAHGPNTQKVLKKLIDIDPNIIACMHGSAWRGNGAKLLQEYAKILG